MKNLEIINKYLLLFIVIIFLTIEISSIKFPGPHPDEGSIPFEALNIKEVFQVNFIQSFLSGNLPLMMGLMKQHGMLDVYILLAIFNIFPVGVESMRAMAIFFGLITILLTYLFMKDFFNRKYALLSVFLLVINPGFIMGTKIGAHYAPTLNAISMGILLCLSRWYRLRRNLYLYISMFLLGLGMWTRLQFFWFVFGLFFTAIIFRSDIKQRFEINKANKFLKYLFLCTVFLSIGCSVIIYHLYITKFSTLRFLWECIKVPKFSEVSGFSNLHYFQNLLVVISNFRDILTSFHYFRDEFQDYGYKFINNLYPWVLLTSMAYLFIIAKLKLDFIFKKKILFLLVLFIGMFMLTPFSPSGYPGFHLYSFYPYIQLIISVAILTFIRYFKKLKIAMVIFCAFFTFFFFKEIRGIKGYLYHLKDSGGRLFYSSAIYDLTEYLLKEKPSKTIVFDWGIHRVIDITSGGLIRPKDLVHKRGNIEAADLFLQDKNVFFIFYPKETRYSSIESFITIVKQLNLVPVEIKRFYERDGSPIYSVYIVREGGKTTNGDNAVTHSATKDYGQY